ncbi:fatty acid desaturase [Flavihumibacter solisilvae]|uniref:Fatty acid desaturase n=1 Tax=Flavihumibacter solisilvae TaxID=1349421 RepID=A0A0C1IPR2_9BACT|nr:fatty acid desaturase [Flavihumibacter solisilvae]KIC96225.1 fatty acid desaturase [Flavihumibacter solisilvae]
MSFIDNILQKPSYGWKNEKGELVIPSTRELFTEALNRVNVFKSRKNWISMISWFMIVCMIPFIVLFVAKHFSWPLFICAAVYSLIIMGTHGTIWFHRYCTHKSYKFSHPVWRFFTQNLVIKTFPEEIYVLSHHVHHAKSDLPGDPYNSNGGLLYCMLSDVNHQSIARDLSEKDYYKAAGLLAHTGVQTNSYKGYQEWGSVATPSYTILLWVLNWAFWYAAFYLLGGHALACALFSSAMLWFIFVRAFNYTGHGKGEKMHVDGLDFDRSNLSINQTRPGLFTGEWHNNHHLYPGSARAGFLPYQLDLAWIFIFSMYKMKLVSSYHDSKKEFLQKYQSNRNA